MSPGLLCLAVWAASGAETEKLAAANTGFALGLVRELVRERPEANVFVSPYSVSAVLQMVDNGAAGQTRAELEQVLGTASLEQANQSGQEIAKSLDEAQSNVVLNIANAIWYRSGTSLLPGFAEANRNFFGATLEALDFSSPSAPGIINGWVDQNTRGKIKNLVAGPLGAEVRIMLANAVYFNGTWARKFDSKETQDRPFHLSLGHDKPTPMMRQRGDFAYQANDRFQSVRLPYLGDHPRMYVVLPSGNSSPEQFLALLNADGWRALTRGFRDNPGTLILPRFKMEYEADLNATLAAMGLKLAFSSHADFSRMSAEPLYLSQVKHKTYVEVNEQGTEAAAATVAIMRATSVRRTEPPFEMIVDRPFLFAIVDEPTQTILFLGVVRNPQG